MENGLETGNWVSRRLLSLLLFTCGLHMSLNVSTVSPASRQLDCNLSQLRIFLTLHKPFVGFPAKWIIIILQGMEELILFCNPKRPTQTLSFDA